MSIRLLLVLSLAALLFGCGLFGSNNEKTKENEPAAVEDLSSSASAEETKSDSAQAYGTDDDSTSIYKLDDPQSPLSIRIIYFDYDSNEILPEYRSVIEAHAAYLVQNPDTTITLEGHADERGSREYNLALGESRALSVKQQMLIFGVSSNQIRLVSYGEERPAVEGHDESAWQQNRRVEFLY